ncbi:MAG: TonB-dependent receptor [Opitutus sp.]|nr:TonB-dependent receptor [Opitutus sp.]
MDPIHMTSTNSPRPLVPGLFSFRIAASFCAALLPLVCFAQSPGPGAITGRIFNPTKGEFVRDARVQVAGSDQVVSSESGGFYRLANVPPGEVKVVVTYTGYSPATATVTILPGQTASLDFELTSTNLRSSDQRAVTLDAFIVSSEREGNAKAIMNQRTSMNITDSVASDVFGDIADGNVATFVKNLPGVEIELSGTVDRTPSLRGLPSQYTQTTLDGMSLASADAAQAGGDQGRSFSFEQVSLSSMDSVEILKTVSADQDANAPAGTINLKTKRAFDRKGRRVAWLTNVTIFSEQFDFGKTYGPDDNKRRREVRPGAILEYSDVFLNNRLGVVLNVTEANLFFPSTTVTNTYNYTPTAADPRPVALTAIALTHTKRIHERFATTLTTDYRATTNLVLSLGVLYNYIDIWSRGYNATLNAGARNTIAGANPLTSFATTDAGGTGRSVTVSGNLGAKYGESLSYLPKFAYKRGDLTLEGRAAVSRSVSNYRPMSNREAVQNAPTNALAGINFRAERSSLTSADWKLTQVSGADWADLSNYTNPRASLDYNESNTRLLSGDLTASLNTRWLLPVTWKTGFKSKRESRDYHNQRAYLTYNYVGPGGGPAGSWGAYASGYNYDLSMVGGQISSLSGRSLPQPNQQAIGTLFRDHPEHFTSAATPANYYTAFIANNRDYEETINSAFFMGTGNVGRLQLRAGLRWEDTTTKGGEFNPLPGSAVAAAGFPVASGRATTIPGLNYQYFSRPRAQRTAGYDQLFPSGSAKYLITRNLNLHLGYSRTIRRPTVDDVTGVWVINEDARTVTAPNPNLKPEISDNLSARLAYYFEPVGILGVNVFENQMQGARTTNQFSAAEFGYGDDPELSSYTFIAGVSSERQRRIRGVEVEYRQSLSFLPGPLRDLNVRASYTRSYADSLIAMINPHMFNAGLSYAYRRFSLNAAFRWTADTPWNATGTQFRRHRAALDGGGAYRLSERISFFFSAKNLLNTPIINMEKVGANPAAGRVYDRMGTLWTFGLKGTL